MWKKEDAKSQGVPEISTAPVKPMAAPSTPSSSSPGVASMLPSTNRADASISQGIKIKGEVTGSEDLFVDGHVDGKLSLTNGSLTIGPNGTVHADVTAREVIVRGKIDGKVTGYEKVQLWGTAQVNGEVQTERLAIEEGALLRGKVEAGKAPRQGAEAKAAAAGKTSDSISRSSGSAAD
jgi:cytoskeletal protein CcmA (bactofilin family)